jgi:hypothetical protein
MVPLLRCAGAEIKHRQKKKRPRRSGAKGEYPTKAVVNLTVLAALLAAAALLATLTALSGLRGLLTRLLLSAALSALAALLAALVLLLIHRMSPWLVPCRER